MNKAGKQVKQQVKTVTKKAVPKKPKKSTATVVTVKRGKGRPTLYKPEYNEQVEKLCLLGATDADIADFFGATETTINNWKNAHSDFFESIKKGKLDADANVAKSLYQRAIGYKHEAVKIMAVAGEVIQEPFIERFPPETTAGIFWLKNRQPKFWRDRVEIKEEIDLNIIPTEQLDATHDKALAEAAAKQLLIMGRFARFGVTAGTGSKAEDEQ